MKPHVLKHYEDKLQLFEMLHHFRPRPSMFSERVLFIRPVTEASEPKWRLKESAEGRCFLKTTGGEGFFILRMEAVLKSIASVQRKKEMKGRREGGRRHKETENI
ncbi:hypothetical protein EYF80_037921 [Liparis tanakae]|uniref:Uncharacterized protein n=1 Tax=Liparis tanakae TaxID=230148 RepID=A0A4Z2GFE8_9TELE|nr:hypothetical protein EYF80_037921 [Liparis tanakae]